MDSILLPDEIALSTSHLRLFGEDRFLFPVAALEDMLAEEGHPCDENPWSRVPSEQRSRIELVASGGGVPDFHDPAYQLFNHLSARQSYYQSWLHSPYPVNLPEFLAWELAELRTIEWCRGVGSDSEYPNAPFPPHPVFLRSESRQLALTDSAESLVQNVVENDRVIGVRFAAHMPLVSSQHYYKGEPMCRPHDFNPIEGEPAEVRWTMRGTEIQSYEKAGRHATHALLQDDTEPKLRPHYFWGGVPIAPFSRSSSHRLVIGGSGTGKSLTFRVLMRSLLPLPEGHPKPQLTEPGVDIDNVADWTRSTSARAVVYNGVGEYLPVLEHAGFKPNGDSIAILDPLDPNCTGWDVATDVFANGEIPEFARALVPDSPAGNEGAPANDGTSQYFIGNSRSLIEAIVHAFICSARKQQRAPAWTLFDILKVVNDRSFEAFFRAHHPAPESVIGILDAPSKDTAGNIESSLRQHLQRYEHMALRWHDAAKRGKKPISLRDFAANGKGTILVLPDAAKNVAVIRPLNELIFQRLTQCLLDPSLNPHSDQHPHTTQVFIDELESAGRFELLGSLAKQGRKFGIEITIGTQSIPGLRKTYGTLEANALLEQFRFRAFYGAQDDTAKWQSEAIGDALVAIQQTQFQSGSSRSKGNTQSEGTSEGENSSTGRTQGASVSSGAQGGSSSSSMSASQNSGRSSSRSVTYAVQNTVTEQSSSTQSTLERFEKAVLQSELAAMPDIKTSGFVRGYFMGPSLPIWKLDVPLVSMLEYGITIDALDSTDTLAKREYIEPIGGLTIEDRERLSLDVDRTTSVFRRPRKQY